MPSQSSWFKQDERLLCISQSPKSKMNWSTVVKKTPQQCERLIVEENNYFKWRYKPLNHWGIWYLVLAMWILLFDHLYDVISGDHTNCHLISGRSAIQFNTLLIPKGDFSKGNEQLVNTLQINMTGETLLVWLERSAVETEEKKQQQQTQNHWHGGCGKRQRKCRETGPRSEKVKLMKTEEGVQKEKKRMGGKRRRKADGDRLGVPAFPI